MLKLPHSLSRAAVLLAVAIPLTLSAPAQAELDSPEEIAACQEALRTLLDLADESMQLSKKKVKPALDEATAKAKEYEDAVLAGQPEDELTKLESEQQAAWEAWLKLDKKLVKLQKEEKKARKEMEKACKKLSD